MDNRGTVREWQAHIIAECESRLGRQLSKPEEIFISARGGFIALEVIEDTVKSLVGEELRDYLNSEDSDNPG